MRNKIIALALTVVMSVLALASCKSSYNYTEEDLGSYTSMDVEAFKTALKNLEIEDADFTGIESVRQKKVIANIYASLASYAKSNGDKKTDGEIGKNDVLYYAYYATYTIDGKEYVVYTDDAKTDYMKETASPKNSISLSQIDVEDEKADKFSVALKNAILALFEEGKTEDDRKVSAYETVIKSGTSVKKADKVTPEYDFIYVSYTRKNETDDITEVTSFEKINLKDTENKLVAKLLDSATTLSVDKNVEIGEDKKTEFTLEIDGKTYKYSSMKVLYAVKSEGKALVSFDYTPFTAEKKTEPANLHVDGSTITIPKDKALTYYVYPVYYYEVSDMDAKSIITEVFAKNVSVNSIDIFASEEYKNGDKTVKELVYELVKIYSSDETKKYDEATKTAEKEKESKETAMSSANTAYEAAKKVVTDKGANATEAEKEAENKAKEAYEAAKTAYDTAEKAYETAKNAQKTDAAKKADEILAAKKEGADAIDAVVVEQYKESVYHSLKEAYDSAIVDNIGKAIWTLVQNSVKVTGHPEKLLNEAVERLKDEYEKDFYTGTVDGKTNSESNYTANKGNFDTYLMKKLGASTVDAIPEKLEAEAIKRLDPIIKLYVASEALVDAGIASNYKLYINENSFIFGEDADTFYLFSSNNETNKTFALYCADNFMVDDDVLKKFKEVYGEAIYEDYLDNYGESNFRTSLQANNFYDCLLAAKLSEKSEDTISKDSDGKETTTTHIHGEYAYTGEGVEGDAYKINFYSIGYKIKADTDSSDK